jgi:hypothetical protein
MAMAGTVASAWDWLSENQVVVWTLSGVSVLSLVAALMLLPRMVARLPADYFKERRRPRRKGGLALRIGKNVLGAMFVVVGAVLLLLPGQGVLMILVGVLLLDFPGKHALERWLVRRKGIGKFLNRMREKRGKPPFELDGVSAAGAGASPSR